jgi:hypothetical protein
MSKELEIMRKILLLVSSAIVLILCFGCARTSHEGTIYVLHSDLMNLENFLVVKLAENEDVLHNLHYGQNMNESSIIEPLVKDERNYLAHFKEVKLLNGVFTDSMGQKLVMKIVQRKVNDQSQNKRLFDIRMWSLGQNGIDEEGRGDDINNWAFPKDGR